MDYQGVTDGDGYLDMGGWSIRITEPVDMGGYSIDVPVKNERVQVNNRGEHKVLDDAIGSKDFFE